MNNRQRQARAARERADPVLYVKQRRPDGRHNAIPLRYLVDDERRDYLRRATSPL